MQMYVGPNQLSPPHKAQPTLLWHKLSSTSSVPQNIVTTVLYACSLNCSMIRLVQVAHVLYYINFKLEEESIGFRLTKYTLISQSHYYSAHALC